MTSTLSILGTTIRQDADGRFCLNDCHKAAGTAKKDGPSYWLATTDAQKLASRLDSETTGKSVVINEGRNGGTYVSKELVYAYAMWINVDFHLTVIRAFDALVTQGLHSVKPLTREQRIAEAFVLLHEDHEKAKEQIAILAPEAEVAKKIASSDGLYTLNLSAKAAQMPLSQFTRAAHANGFIFKQNGKWNAYSDKVKAGYCCVKFHPYRDRDGDERFSPQVFFTPKGITRLVKITGQH